VRRGWIALLLLVGCRDVLGIEELSRAVPDVGVDAGVDARSCSLNAATGVCHACLERSCCQEIEACNGDETCRPTLSCVLQCPPGDEVCAAKCVNRFGEKLANVVSCRARSCAAQCGISCGGTFGVTRPKHVANNAKCAECYRTKFCDENIACANDPLCVRYMGCPWSCALLDRACNTQCRFPLGPQPLADGFQNKLRDACRTDCGDGRDWSCVDQSKYPGGTSVGEVEFNFVLYDALRAGEKLKDVTFRPCVDSECMAEAGKSCKTDESGYCSMKLRLTAPGNVFRGVVEATGGGLYPTLYFMHPAIAGEWPGTPAYAPAGVYGATQAAVDLGGPLVDVTLMEGRGHLIVTIFDCLWATAPDLTIEVARADGETKYRYIADGLPSKVAKTTDTSGIAYAFNIPASKEQTRVTAKLGDKVVAETAVFIRANTLSFGNIGPK
jgi:hypothetical protein